MLSLLVRALLCSTRHAAMRRGTVRRSVNPWRTTQRTAAQILVVGARTLGLVAQTMVTVLGTRFGAQNYEIPLRRRMPRCLVRALLCSARHSAMRRGIVWLSVNPGRAATRIAAQMLAVGVCSRGFLMHKQWSPF